MGRADACDKAYSVENRLNAIVTPVGQMATFVRSNSAAEQTIATWTIPAGDALVAGWTYQLLGFGDVSTVLTPTLTMRLRITNPAGALLGAGPAAVTGSGINAVSIGVDAKVMLESIGVSGKFSLIGNIFDKTPNPLAAYPVIVRNQTLDTTAAIVVAWTAQFSVANAGNIVEGDAGMITRMRAG